MRKEISRRIALAGALAFGPAVTAAAVLGADDPQRVHPAGDIFTSADLPLVGK